ncbi:hypothetical protein V3391_14270 [Luteimonas sp. SMYT11W]|uniref:Uncharacterized protein n=1 Tax=Luteimonas flava TaxID=3115822 RepID=A0ABU7WIF3_9GAMM
MNLTLFVAILLCSYKNHGGNGMPDNKGKRARTFDTFSQANNLLETKNLEEAHSLSSFFSSSLKCINYESDPRWVEAISLTLEGKNAKLELDAYPEATAMQALFIDFYHLDIYIDTENSNLPLVFEILNDEIKCRRIILPNRFGRELYDKYNSNLRRHREDHLSYEESLELTGTTEAGVYQVGTLVSGPFGLLRSPVRRLTPPSLSLPLWHCSDVGCRVLHQVRLIDDQSPLSRAIRTLQNKQVENLGPHADWGAALRSLVIPERGTDPFSYTDLGPMVADSIHGQERAVLVAQALASDCGKRLRTALKSGPAASSELRRSPEEISAALSQGQLLQLLHLLSDDELVRLIDAAVFQQSIRIPSNEVRKSKNIPRATRHSSELSSLGVRCVGKSPLVDLCSLIWEAYTCSEKTADLEWNLRVAVGGASTRNALLLHLCKIEPSDAVRELVLSSGDVSRHIANAIGCPIDHANDSGFIDRVLWKLGFNTPRYSLPIQHLRQRLDFFSQEILAVGALKHERDRERIRSAGVNLFVSVETYLQELIRYNVWVLSSDHYLGTQFVYNTDEAMEAVANTLGPTVASGSVTVHWSTTGDNTLGTLLAYLQATLNWMKGLPSSDRSAFLRHENDLPHYYSDKFRVFPFKHTELWADSDYSALQRIYENFNSISAKLMRSKLAEIRNGLDHQRDESRFPSIDLMLAFVAHFREAMETSEALLFYPKEFWTYGTETDRYDRTTTKLYDYARRQHVLYGPSVVYDVQRSLSPKHPILIAPGSPLGFANSEITFQIANPSIHSKYWSNYPIRPPGPDSGNPNMKEASGSTNQFPDSTDL